MNATHYTPVASNKPSLGTKQYTPQNFKRSSRKNAKQAQYLFRTIFQRSSNNQFTYTDKTVISPHLKKMLLHHRIDTMCFHICVTHLKITYFQQWVRHMQAFQYSNHFQLLVLYTFHNMQSFCSARSYQLTWKVTILKQILLLPYATIFIMVKPERSAIDRDLLKQTCSFSVFKQTSYLACLVIKPDKSMVPGQHLAVKRGVVLSWPAASHGAADLDGLVQVHMTLLKRVGVRAASEDGQGWRHRGQIVVATPTRDEESLFWCRPSSTIFKTPPQQLYIKAGQILSYERPNNSLFQCVN